MEFELRVNSSAPRQLSKKAFADAVKKMAECWRSGDRERAVGLLNEIFSGDAPEAEALLPYVKEFGVEFRDLVAKLYLLHCREEDDEWEWNLGDFEDGCDGGFFSGLAARLVGRKWEELREEFYDKCPECLFLGDEDDPYSLKLRSENCIECIPAGDDLHELASPAEDYARCADGYSLFEGYALVKDDPAAKTKYPPKRRAVLKAVEARELKYFPNVIFPLVEGEDILDSCRQMSDLLQLLDYGYRFESISRYITAHPELFPELMKKRLSMLLPSDEDGDEEDGEFEFDLDDLEDDDPESEDAEEAGNAAADGKTPPPAAVPPEPDPKRIAADEARGIRFGGDRRILEEYPENLRAAGYEIPAGVIAVAKSAFNDCKSLKSVTIPEGVMFIGGTAFSDCEKLTAVTLPSSVVRIGAYAFSGCKSLTEAAIPEGVTAVEQGTFSDCSKLKKVAIPATVARIGEHAFSECASLTRVAIPEGVTEIGKHTFRGCGALTGVTLPSSVAKIGEYAFSECEKLTRVEIPEGVTEIEGSTFWGCSKLKEVVLPARLARIGESAFSGCRQLVEIEIPEGVTEIGEDAFMSCESLTRAAIPAGVTAIEDAAFILCKGLRELVISEGVLSIGEKTFAGCESLTEVVIPEGVLIIGAKAFKRCTKLAKVVLPASVISVGDEAFAECPCEAELKKKHPALFS